MVDLKVISMSYDYDACTLHVTCLLVHVQCTVDVWDCIVVKHKHMSRVTCHKADIYLDVEITVHVPPDKWFCEAGYQKSYDYSACTHFYFIL